MIPLIIISEHNTPTSLEPLKIAANNNTEPTINRIEAKTPRPPRINVMSSLSLASPKMLRYECISVSIQGSQITCHQAPKESSK